MRATPRYPVDRYLVENSTKIEMVNINDDDLWNSEPALRPEDEVMLRQLHDMLQTTADDLKLLTGQLAQNRPPPVNTFHKKNQPVPFDEEFNEKIHIEELVNAKFFGHNVIDKSTLQNPFSESPKFAPKPNVNTGVQVDTLLNSKKPVVNKNLEVTKTRIIEIQEKKSKSTKESVNTAKAPINAPAVAYNEFIYENVEPTTAVAQRNKLKKQDLPSINIRSELKEQKVLQLDIFPDDNVNEENVTNNVNVGVITVEHEKITPKEDPKIVISNKGQTSRYSKKRIPVRKSTKMLTCESSGSTNNNSSDTQLYSKAQKQIKSIIRPSTKSQTHDRSKNKKNNLCTKEADTRSPTNLEEWKRKLNLIYGQPSTSRSGYSKVNNTYLKKSNLSARVDRPKSGLNNAEYIPYSKLTLGGVKVSDIEREISDVRNKNDMPLSHLVDKILSSRENSFHTETPKKSKPKGNKESPRIFTTSDENLLHEVIDIEKTVTETIEKSLIKKDKNMQNNTPLNSSESKEEEDKNSYADDFEEDKSDDSQNESKNESDGSEYQKEKATSDNDSNPNTDNIKMKPIINTNVHNKTFTKAQTLAIKESVEVFEFIHSVDTQDSATQSQTIQKISLKETQTSPRNDKLNIQPIHNDLWPLDPEGEVEKMFKLEKDFIKKLIVEEYGELLEKKVAKPSTSTDSAREKQQNVSAMQKITQTSPARVKSVMTSPTRTKTRTTSPFLSLTVDHQTSPMIVVTNEEQLTLQVEDDEEGISINLSSPRFNLRLPQSSREVLSNLEGASVKSTGQPKDPKKKDEFPVTSKTYRKNIVSSSSSEVENSSEMSSLGEVKLKLKRRIKKRISSISESSKSSSMSKYSSSVPYGEIIPLKSEGEASFGQAIRKGSNKTSEGETSLRKVPK